MIFLQIVFQQKMKEQRNLRFQELQMPHRHLCDMVALNLGIEPNEVMDGVIDEQLQVELLENFLNKGKTRCLIFFYQDGPPYSIGKSVFNFSI